MNKLSGKVIAIEVYDDLIRYDGKPIWMGSPYRKTDAEVNAIVADYLNAQPNKESE